MAQRSCVQLRGDTCTVGTRDNQYISNAPEAWGSDNVRWIATAAAEVSERDYDFTDSVAQRICEWIGIRDTSSGWGKVVKSVVKAGLDKLLRSGWYAVYRNYEVSVTNGR